MTSQDIWLEITVHRQTRLYESRNEPELYQINLEHHYKLWALYKKKEKEEGVDHDLTLENAYLAQKQKRLKNRKTMLHEIRRSQIVRWA